ncbi:MAG: hypothetical protein L0Y62_05925, partial [Nitrospirae bacterium]|nr:hypothetical protein [Nitrospirota bacterium]
RQRLTQLDTSLVNARDECETKIALIKAGKTEGEESKDTKVVKTPPPVLKPQVTLKTQRTVKGTLLRTKKALQLTDEQAEGIKAVISDYQKERDGIYAGIKHGKEFRFGSFEYLDRLSDASQKAQGKIKQIIGEAKYRLMLEKGLDMELGIRIPEKADKKEEGKKSESVQPQSGVTEIK